MEKQIKRWVLAAFVRALKTAAQAALGAIGASTIMGDVNWIMCGSAALLAAIVSLITSLAGIPEVGEGASVIKLAKAQDSEVKVGGTD